MLKIKKHDDPSKQLLSKGREIVITNVCNLNCGGCCQLIGHFRKDQLWFIPLEELEENICLLEKHPPTDSAKKPITIFGGEPTLHPQWDEIIKILKNHAPTVFWINTNGRLGHQRYQKEDNLVWWVDLHPASQLFVQTLFAAADVVKLEDDLAYWEKAKKDCPIWNGCQASVYKNKAYFCENAAAIDWLYHNGEHGWELEDGKNPFERTKQEIEDQAKHACKRCGWCVTELVPRQLSKDPSYVSPLNQTTEKKNSHTLPVIEPVRTPRWSKADKLEILTEPVRIGIYCLGNTQQSDWLGVTWHTAANKDQALQDGKANYDWTVILENNQVIPYYAFLSLLNWFSKEKVRKYVSIPVHSMKSANFDMLMSEPEMLAKDVVIGFHKDSKEPYDNQIYSKLGHRNKGEGSGRPSLWHEELTDIVGGIIELI